MEFYSMSEERELKDDNLDSVLVCWSIVVFFKVENPGDRVGLGRNLVLVYEYIRFQAAMEYPCQCPVGSWIIGLRTEF